MRQSVCRLCGAPTDFKFELPLAYGITGHYYECRHCRFLHSDHLDDPAASKLVYTGTLGEGDAGAAWRERCVLDRVMQLARFGLFRRGPRCRVLDFGCGPGYVANFLKFRKGWDVYGFDPYVAPLYLPTRILSSQEQLQAYAPFDLIIATEVLEHFVDPVAELGKISGMMADGGFLYVTTGLYRSDRGENWTYLAPQGGQHVSFYSRSALGEVRRILGASAVYRVGAEYEWLFVRGSLRKWQAGVVCSVLTWLVRLGLIARIE